MIKQDKILVFAITGRFQSFKREIAIILIEILGRTYKPFVGQKKTVLVTGYFTIDLFDETKQSTKLITAKNNHISTISEMTFLKWLITQFKSLSENEKQDILNNYQDILHENFLDLESFQDNKLITELITFLERKLTII